MNPTNPKLNWVRVVSMLGVLLAAIASYGFTIILTNWDKLEHHRPGDIVDEVGPFVLIAWLGELICGMIILKHRKIIGRILIGLGILFLFLSLIFPAST